MDKTQNNPDQWLNEHGDYLYRYAMSRLRNEEQAADMVQETLLAAWKGLKNFSGNSSLRTWLVGILKHKIIDLIRKEIRGRDLNDAVENDPTSAWFDPNGSWSEAPQAWQDDPESLFENEQFRQTLEKCISKLPAKQQDVFRLRELTGEDTDYICKTCDISPTHLHVLIHRARVALRLCLEHHWFGGKK
ncbi:MAG: sigma-70 family RNA polymerase sigma factor [Mariprofundaceae bacterium]